jgi:hypothetical protein
VEAPTSGSRTSRSFSGGDEKFNHIILKLKSGEFLEKRRTATSTEWNDRSKKSANGHVIETAVFVDEHLFEKFKDVFDDTIDIERRIVDVVMAMITSVSLLLVTKSFYIKLVKAFSILK